MRPVRSGGEAGEEWEWVPEVRLVVPGTLSDFLECVRTAVETQCRVRTATGFVVATPICLERRSNGTRWVQVRWWETVYSTFKQIKRCWVEVNASGDGVEENGHF
jgi:hypothetical protein